MPTRAGPREEIKPTHTWRETPRRCHFTLSRLPPLNHLQPSKIGKRLDGMIRPEEG